MVQAACFWHPDLGLKGIFFPVGIKWLARVEMVPLLPHSETLLCEWALKSWCWNLTITSSGFYMSQHTMFAS